MSSTHGFARVSAADWRAQVDKELAGRSFEKVLVDETLEGLAIAPLYTEAPAGSDDLRERRPSAFRICLPYDATDETAEATWYRHGDGLKSAPHGFRVVETSAPARALAQLARAGAEERKAFALDYDPVGLRARGQATFESLRNDLLALAESAHVAEKSAPGSTTVMVSTLPYHDAGADAADELAIALSTGALYLGSLLDAGLAADFAARQIALRVSVGRDTFLELCKLRALRTCWQKVLVASKTTAQPRALVHAVCSSRTLTVRDPWVNMLRVTTQVFAAILGGADLITPLAFDQALGSGSELGRRVARNTGLVLREESYLGKVTDPAGGSYYLDSVTDALARSAWERFRALERDGGIVAALESGRLTARLEATWTERLARIAKRKTPIVGVSEFANLTETLPAPMDRGGSSMDRGSFAALPVHRDAAAFEELRDLAEKLPSPPEAVLVTLGPLAESRPRAGFASGFFAAGGIRSRESTVDEKAPLACVCGSDERYAAEAVTRVRALKAAGCHRVLVAGRPGALEASLREAGASGFIFAGCDVVATLADLLGGWPS